MAGETVVTIVGNLTGDPETRTTQSGTHVAGFTVASTTRSRDKATGAWVDSQALFLRCSAWRDLADHVAGSLSKGMRVIVQGRLSQRSWEAKDGSKRTSVELTVDEIGPSLRHATAQVTRLESRGFQGTYGAPSQPLGGPQPLTKPDPVDPFALDMEGDEF